VNGPVVDVELSVLGVDVALKTTMDGVVLEHIDLYFRSIRADSVHNDRKSTDHVVQIDEGTVDETTRLDTRMFLVEYELTR